MWDVNHCNVLCWVCVEPGRAMELRRCLLNPYVWMNVRNKNTWRQTITARGQWTSERMKLVSSLSFIVKGNLIWSRTGLGIVQIAREWQAVSRGVSVINPVYYRRCSTVHPPAVPGSCRAAVMNTLTELQLVLLWDAKGPDTAGLEETHERYPISSSYKCIVWLFDQCLCKLQQCFGVLWVPNLHQTVTLPA